VERRLVVAMVVALALCVVSAGWADLTMLARLDQEIKQQGRPEPAPAMPAVPGLEGLPVPPAPPDVQEPTEQTLWLRAYLAENMWRRDAFDQDPRAVAGEPTISVLYIIGANGAGKSTLLDWERRTATVMPDEAFEQLGQSMDQLREMLQQMPQGAPMPAGMQGFLHPTPPVITVKLDGPQEQMRVLDLSCEKWQIEVETRDGPQGGEWGHTHEVSWQVMTDDLPIPRIDRDVWDWDVGLQAAMWQQAYDEAVEGLEFPGGFPVKSYTIERKMDTGRVVVKQMALVEYQEGAIDPTTFEVPEGFTIQQLTPMGLPEGAATGEGAE